MQCLLFQGLLDTIEAARTAHPLCANPGSPASVHVLWLVGSGEGVYCYSDNWAVADNGKLWLANVVARYTMVSLLSGAIIDP